VICLAWEGDWPLTQAFGARPAYYARFGLPAHNGIDIGCPEGTILRALFAGEVSEVWFDQAGYGWYCKLRHENGPELLYAHQRQAPAVSEGDLVMPGDTLGVSGNTGNSDGPHLHLGMRADWRYRQHEWRGWVDPTPYLGLLAG
jgi:murein DD-endopeptidase MepM/ murein hydrolase activator NlpD